jgi:hypothetical protein
MHVARRTNLHETTAPTNAHEAMQATRRSNSNDAIGVAAPTTLMNLCKPHAVQTNPGSSLCKHS